MNTKLEETYCDIITPYLESFRDRCLLVFEHHQRDISWEIYERSVLPDHEPGSPFDQAVTATSEMTKVFRDINSNYREMRSNNMELVDAVETLLERNTGLVKRIKSLEQQVSDAEKQLSEMVIQNDKNKKLISDLKERNLKSALDVNRVDVTTTKTKQKKRTKKDKNEQQSEKEQLE